MFSLRFILGTLLVGSFTLDSIVASGQDYPKKPIRVITAAAGGGSDATARRIAQGISEPLGQPMIVDNRQSIVTGEIAAKAPPDGYTLLVNGNSVWMTTLTRKAPYDVIRDLAPISLIERSVNIVAVSTANSAQTIKELIALAKANPGKFNYSAGQFGTTKHLAGELFSSMAGIKLVYVPYTGISSEISAVLSGEVQLTINDANVVMTQVKAGKLRALAVTSSQPSVLAPSVPTVAASGLPGYEAIGTTDIWAPAKTPEAIINRLNKEIVRYLNKPEVKEKFISTGTEVVANSPDEFGAYIKSDIGRVTKLISDLGLKTQ